MEHPNCDKPKCFYNKIDHGVVSCRKCIKISKELLYKQYPDLEEKEKEKGISPNDALKTLQGAFKDSGVCEKHGRVMLHPGKCKECRREENKNSL